MNHSTHVPPPQNWLLSKSIMRTLLGLFNPKLWVLSLLPVLIAGTVWAGVAWLGWDFFNQSLRNAIDGVQAPLWMPNWLPERTVWIPLAILLTLMPAVFITALGLVNALGVGVIAQRVAKHYGLPPMVVSPLERSQQMLASLWHSLWIMAVLGVIWLLSLPLWLVFGMGLLAQILALAWANARLLSRDVLIDFATTNEINLLFKAHRRNLWGLGLIASLPAMMPSLLWLWGGLWIVALPLIALLALWLEVLIFLATALLFSHYLIPALLHQRQIELQTNSIPISIPIPIPIQIPTISIPTINLSSD